MTSIKHQDSVHLLFGFKRTFRRCNCFYNVNFVMVNDDETHVVCLGCPLNNPLETLNQFKKFLARQFGVEHNQIGISLPNTSCELPSDYEFAGNRSDAYWFRFRINGFTHDEAVTALECNSDMEISWCYGAGENNIVTTYTW